MQKNYAGAITAFEQAISMAPDLALAYLDLCSSQTQISQYDQAIVSCKKGLAVSQQDQVDWKAKLNHNAGLASFKKMLATQDYGNSSAENHFRAALKLDKDLGESSFLLGTIYENIKGDAKFARNFYEQGCSSKNEKACTALKGFAERSKKLNLCQQVPLPQHPISLQVLHGLQDKKSS